jgi:hypothetical protein
MSMAELQWFDRLASREIDPALCAVLNESKNRDPEYLIDADLGRPGIRDRCLLTITSQHVNKLQLAGSLTIIAGPGNTVRVEQSYRWPGKGQIIPIMTLNAADVTQDKIRSLAREFVAEFFQRLLKGKA